MKSYKNFKQAAEGVLGRPLSRWEIERGVARNEQKQHICFAAKNVGAKGVSEQYFDGNRFVMVVEDDVEKHLENHSCPVTIFKGGIHKEMQQKEVYRKIFGRPGKFKTTVDVEVETDGVVLAGIYEVVDYVDNTIIFEKV